MRVVAATASPVVEETAPDIGVEGAIGPLLFKLVKAAPATAVAKAFPFRIRHFFQ
jgi:hypothetical protein